MIKIALLCLILHHIITIKPLTVSKSNCISAEAEDQCWNDLAAEKSPFASESEEEAEVKGSEGTEVTYIGASEKFMLCINSSNHPWTF